MPRTHVRAFQVRHYECDALGQMHPANYLRYMQETAFDASAAAGYNQARYAAMGYLWLIRETELDVLHPLRYGDPVQVQTWVVDFRRVRSRRAYEVRHAETGALVARAQTDWAFLDSASGRPAAIPVEMKAAFFPEGPPDLGPPRARFPSAPPPPPGVFRTWRRAEWRDLDQVGHVNNAVYLAYFDECAVQAAAAHGWPPARLQAEGLAIAGRQHQIEYREPAVLGDELAIETWLSDLDGEGGSAVRHYTLSRVSDGALVSRARTVWGVVDLASGEPAAIPAAFLADLAPNTAGLEPLGDLKQGMGDG